MHSFSAKPVGCYKTNAKASERIQENIYSQVCESAGRKALQMEEIDKQRGQIHSQRGTWHMQPFLHTVNCFVEDFD